MRRHEARQFALQALYQIDVGKSEMESAINHVLEDVKEPSAADVQYIQRLVSGTRANLVIIDGLLEENVQGWKINRIARVDLNVLRMALYELLKERDVDEATVVDEAVELAKSFSTDASSKFVNGVLARLLPVVQVERKQSAEFQDDKAQDMNDEK